jgi:single-strand DNA-binding protein
MAYKAEGRLHKIFPTEQKTASFSAREFVIEVQDGQYPQMVKFQLTQDKCEIMDDYNEGDQIVVDFDLRGREWNDKYFTNLNAWRVAAAGSDGGSAGGGQSSVGAPEDAGKYPPSATDASADFDDDIPF